MRRTLELVERQVHLSAIVAAELTQFTKDGKWWPRTKSVIVLDSFGKSTFQYPTLTRKDALFDPKKT